MDIDRHHIIDGSRYQFDMELCPPHQGWAQWDTAQDASYYGTWINPFRLQIVNYAEGDVAITTCETEAEFKAEALRTDEWHRSRGYNPNIDPGFTTGRSGAQIASRLKALGLAELMHASSREAFETGP